MTHFKFIFSVLFMSYISLTAQSVNDLLPRNEPFFIQSAQNFGIDNKGYWDISGGEDKIREKAKIQVWQLEKSEKDRRYIIDNSVNKAFVRIHIDGVAGYLDIQGGSNKNGADLIIYGPNDKDNQNFTFKYLGNGKFKIFGGNGKLIALEGRSSQNGKAIVMWDDHDGPWTEWVLVSVKTNKPLLLDDAINKKKLSIGDDMSGIKTVYIQSAINFGRDSRGYFDIPGRKNPQHGNNIQVYELSDFDPDRKYDIFQSNSSFAHYSIAPSCDNTLLVTSRSASQKSMRDIMTNRKPATQTLDDIGLTEMKNIPAQNFTFRHLGGGKFKIYNHEEKVICLGQKSSQNGSNVMLGDDDSGAWTEWYLLDAETNRPFIPKNAMDPASSMPALSAGANPAAAETAGEIDGLYGKTGELLNKSDKVIVHLIKGQSAMGGAFYLTENLEGLTAKVSSTSSALNPMTRIPTIGTAIKPFSISLDFSLNQLEKVKTGVSALKAPVIQPADNNMNFALTKNIILNSQLRLLQTRLVELKSKLTGLSASPQGADSETAYSEIRQSVTQISAELVKAEKHIDKIDKIGSEITKFEKPINKVNKGIDNFEKHFKKVSRIADDVNDVLDKRFKEKIAGVKVNISLRDVVEGGKVGKVFDKYVNDWAQDLLKPVLKKFDVKLPAIEGIEEFKKALDNSLDFTKKARENSEGLDKVIENINRSMESIDKKLAG